MATMLVGLAFFVPLYIVLVNSVKPSSEIAAGPLQLPTSPTLANFAKALSPDTSNFLASLLTSIVVTVSSVVVSSLLSASLAYVLARSRRSSVRALLLVLLAGLMIPSQVLLVPLADILGRVGLMGTLPGLVLFNLGFYLPFGVFVYYRFVLAIPRELDEAAAIDGASKFRTFWSVIFPLMRPVTASVVIFLSVWIWNDFLSPLIILGPGSGTTVTTGIYQQVSQFSSDYGAVFALMVLASAPILVLFLSMQRYFVSGLTAGATKG